MVHGTADTAERQGDEPDVGRDSLSDRIYAHLRVALMSGQYEPGARLNIRRLATLYNTSSTPVREAIFQLVREGALELRLGHQPRVPVLTVEKYLRIRTTRVPLERLAAELAAVRIEPADIQSLRRHHEAFIRAEQEERWKDALLSNQELHFTVYRASANDVLVRVLENLWLLAGPFVNNQYPIARNPNRGVHPHLFLIDALERRSPGEAGDMMVRDLMEGSHVILEKVCGEGK